jgi:hypothetical protein
LDLGLIQENCKTESIMTARDIDKAKIVRGGSGRHRGDRRLGGGGRGLCTGGDMRPAGF